LNHNSGDFIYVKNGYIVTIHEFKEVARVRLSHGRNVLRNPLCITNDEMIVIPEYWANKKREAVNVYLSRDKGLSWESRQPYKSGLIKHFHGAFYDKYTDSIWLLSGDSNEESKIATLNKNFDDLKIIGEGAQVWRACHIFFTDSHVYWFTDSPVEANFLVKYDRCKRSIELIRTINAPVIYAASYPDGYLVSTSSEPGLGCKSVKVLLSYDLNKWITIASFKKDMFPYQMQFGAAMFSFESNSLVDAYVNFQALEGNDGLSMRLGNLIKG
jgi:hypothetical protein